jgi:hypothetical protein
MNKKTLTPEQAFRAMFIFLSEYYERTQRQAELASVLSDIQTNRTDGLPADPAAWGDWLAAIKSVREKSS